MKVTNVEWDIESDELIDFLHSMPTEEAADAIDLDEEVYIDMNDTELENYLQDYFIHNNNSFDFLELPDEVEVPVDFDTAEEDVEETIREWLVQEYGWGVISFDIQ